MLADRLLCAKDVAKRLSISTRTLWRRIRTHEAPLPVLRSRGRRALWRESDVSSFIASLRPARQGESCASPALDEPDLATATAAMFGSQQLQL